MRIEIYYQTKQWHDILEDCETINDLVRKKEKLEKSDHIALYWAEHNHAYAWMRLGEYEKAEREIREMIRKAPIDRRSYSDLAELYARQKDYKRALQYLDQAMVLSEPDWTDLPGADNSLEQIAEELVAKTGKESAANYALAAAHAES